MTRCLHPIEKVVHMKQFKIKENGFKEIRKQTLMRVIPLLFNFNGRWAGYF